MKILLTHAYTKENKGDAAIVSVLLRQLNTAFPGSNITISIYDDDAKYKSFEGYKVISNSMYLSLYRFQSLLFKLLYTFYIESSLLLWALLYRFFGRSITFVLSKSTCNIAHEYLASDLFVPVGGGYLRAKKGIRENINILLSLNPIIIGILLKKPIILYTQSIGPFATAFQGWITRIVLNKTQLILMREDHTIKTLKTIGVKANLVTRTTDAGFLFDSDKEFRLSDLIKNAETLKSKTLVGITVRKWLKQEGQDNFEKAIALFVDRITKEKHISILFIPQVTSTVHNDDDRNVANRIVSLVANQQQVINCTGNYDHYELKKLYSCLDFLVGTRFHSVIFSLTSYVPAIAIEYEYKTSGIMKDLGLSEWVIPMEQVTADNLYEKFRQLLSEEDAYKQQLQQTLPNYILKAKEVENQMKEAYHSFKLLDDNR
ncbi:MAG TPA: polysaccharide pyruvyl transferase family protein [Methylomirabilota bacterium]|nr:polysaccharide pyruvyl transferase family protein [Methylomirabilota bacterium]